jgi:hypothetical protein
MVVIRDFSQDFRPAFAKYSPVIPVVRRNPPIVGRKIEDDSLLQKSHASNMRKMQIPKFSLKDPPPARLTAALQHGK